MVQGCVLSAMLKCYGAEGAVYNKGERYPIGSRGCDYFRAWS